MFFLQIVVCVGTSRVGDAHHFSPKNNYLLDVRYYLNLFVKMTVEYFCTFLLLSEVGYQSSLQQCCIFGRRRCSRYGWTGCLFTRYLTNY